MFSVWTHDSIELSRFEAVVMRIIAHAWKISVAPNFFTNGGQRIGLRGTVRKPIAIWSDMFCNWTKSMGVSGSLVMKITSRIALISILVLGLAACVTPNADEGRKVDASGKEDIDLDAVPAEVLAAARASQPELDVSEAEFETRDGNEYYDLGGTLPDGSELELDITKIDGVWTVVETQRDIELQATPEVVVSALHGKVPGWSPDRIIESDQGDGVVIYEFFGEDAEGEETKIEVKYEAGQAEVLVDEWLH